jgi:lysophospholipase L1-like esterase
MYRHTLFYTFLLLIFLSTSCEQPDYAPYTEKKPPLVDAPQTDTLRYLALGDSYTIGEGVNYSSNFPSQLVKQVNELPGERLYMLAPKVIARTGWTAARLLEEATSEILPETYDFITLLIGVNNQFQRRPFSEFEEDYEALLAFALSKTGGDSSRLVLVSIPDYAYTPFGQNSSDPEQISFEIDKYNAFIEQKAAALHLTFVNITDISREGLAYPELLAPDGLHPSATMYEAWVERILPYVQ